MNDYRRDQIPRLGRLSSLLFAFDVIGFLQLGRRLGFGEAHTLGMAWNEAKPPKPWQFWLGGQVVTVLSTRVDAEALLKSGRVRMFRPEVLAPVLGRFSPLLVEGPDHERARRSIHRHMSMYIGGYRGEAVERRFDDLVRDTLILEAIQTRGAKVNMTGPPSSPVVSIDGEVEVCRPLRAAAVTAVVGELCRGRPELVGRAAEIAVELADAITCAACVVPALRLVTPRWRKVAPLRRRLLAALDLSEASAAEQDAVVSLIVGGSEGPAMVAARALTYSSWPRWRVRRGDPYSRTQIIARALSRPTLPLLLRETTAPLMAAGVDFEPGDAIAVDSELVGLPFGYGAHACPGRSLTQAFAESALRVAEELHLFRVGGRDGRRGLFYGPTKVVMTRTPAFNPL
mgnify:CR=1 FL=1